MSREDTRSKSRTPDDHLRSQQQAFMEFLERKFDNFADQMKLKATAPEVPSFKYKGNALAYKFNSEITASLTDLKGLILQGSKQRSATLVDAILQQIQKRNKLIRMADRSEAGWATVQEYLSDDLADDSADEKKIRAAEERALSRKRKEERPTPRFPYPKKSRSATATITAPPQTVIPTIPQTILIQPQSGSDSSRRHYSQGAKSFRSAFAGTRNRGSLRTSGYTKNWSSRRFNDGVICFSCGKNGHYRRECPNS